jgi:hypothetical protein
MVKKGKGDGGDS